MNTHKGIYKSPVGDILIESDGNTIIGLNFCKEETNINSDSDAVIQLCISELTQYFDGTLKEFTVPVFQKGTLFRQKVWDALRTIAYGKTASYKEMAVLIENPKASRAVGSANHNNNINIIVPCHRVIGSNGSLVGYGGELWRKKWLLEHEQRNS